MAVPAPVILNSVITKRVIPSPLSSPLGLRPNPDQYALRSSFFSPSIHLLTLPPLIPASSGRFSMRVTSKKAYICRDCGYVYNDRTPFEKLPDKYSCPGTPFSLILFPSVSIFLLHIILLICYSFQSALLQKGDSDHTNPR